MSFYDALLFSKGQRGKQGYSAYEIAVQNGYEGTEEEWANSFLSPTGYYTKTETDNKLKKKAYYFDNVASMKNATNLKDGDYVITLGYYEANDGGGADYLIRTKVESDVDDGGSIHVIGNLVAELISNSIFPEMFGAYGNGVHNDTHAFIALISKFNEVNLQPYKTYKLTSLSFAKDFTINGNNAILIDDTNVEHFIEMTTNSSNKTLKIFNLNIDCPNSNIGLYINNNRLIANYITVKNAIEKCINVVKTGSYGTCALDNIRCQLSNTGIHIQATDCFISKYIGYNCKTHLINEGGITHLNSFHGWNFNSSNKDWVTDSCLIETYGDLMANDVYIDTLEIGIKLPDDRPYNSYIFQNLSYFLNLSSYPSTQNAPKLLYNTENFKGYCKIDGIFVNENNWKDSNGNYPHLLENELNLTKIDISNVSNSGFRFNNISYKPLVQEGDIATSEYVIEDKTYFAPSIRKYKFDKYKKRIFLVSSLRRNVPNDTLCLKMDFSEGENFKYLDRTSIVNAIFIKSDIQGKSLKLDAYIHEGILYIYNNTGTTLTSGNLWVNIDYDNILI